MKILINWKYISSRNIKLLRSILCISLFVIPSISVVHANEEQGYLDALTKAIELREDGKNREAIKILESLKINFNDHKRVNVELLINYINLKQINDAESILIHIKALELSPNEKEKIAVLEKNIEALKKANIPNKKRNKQPNGGHHFNAQISAFWGVDEFTSSLALYDFVELGSVDDLDAIDDSDSDYFDERTDEIEPKNKISYSALQTRLGHHYKSDQAFNLFGAKSQFNWKNRVTLYHKKANNSSVENYKQYKIDSNFQIRQANQWLFDTRIRLRSHFIGSRKILSEKGIQLSASMPLITDHRIKIGVENRKKTYTTDLELLDANVLMPWVEYTVKLGKNYKLYLGGRFRENNAKDEFSSYNNKNFYFSLRYYSFNKFNAYITFNDNSLGYDIDDPDIVYWGEESKNTLAMGAKYQFTKNLSLGVKFHKVNKEIHLYDTSDISSDWKRIETFINYRF